MEKRAKTAASASCAENRPSPIERFLRWEVLKVARRFRLADEARQELECHVRYTVYVALLEKYDPARGPIGAFAARLVRHCLCKWMDRETKRRNRFTAMTPEVEERVNNIPAPVSDAAERARLIARVRLTVRSLSPRARRVCELYMRLGSLEAVRKALHKSPRDFYNSVWPDCRREFAEKYASLLSEENVAFGRIPVFFGNL